MRGLHMDNPIVSTDLTESKEVEQGKEITEYNTPNCDNEKKDEYISIQAKGPKASNDNVEKEA